MFLTAQQDLRQSYVYSEGSVLPVAMRDGRSEMSYSAVSGRQGPELFDTALAEKLPESLKAV